MVVVNHPTANVGALVASVANDKMRALSEGGLNLNGFLAILAGHSAHIPVWYFSIEFFFLPPIAVFTIWYSLTELLREMEEEEVNKQNQQVHQETYQEGDEEQAGNE